MKINKKKNVTEKVCKKCGAPLISKSRYKKCDHCRREAAKQRRGILEGIGGLGLLCFTLIPGIRHFVKKK